MSGIIGYIGKRKAFPVLWSGLLKLEKKGYDSFGFAVLEKNKEPFYYKKAGKISEFKLEKKIEGTYGIAHTRWATSGEVSDKNAHPQTDCSQNIFVVHNGVIQNYKELKEELKKDGHKFVSDTDTEVIAHLIEDYFLDDLESAVKQALKRINGAYGIAVVSQRDPDKIVVAKVSSPLLIGCGNDETIISSDSSAIIAYTEKIIELDDYEIAVITKDGVSTTKEEKPEKEEVDRGSYAHFMLKEIAEESQAVINATKSRLLENNIKLGGLDLIKDQLKNVKKIYIVGCGTSYYAGLLGKYYIEELAGIPVEVSIASEFKYRKFEYEKDSIGVFVSQSGETADTLGALREMKGRGNLTIGITNVVGSSQSKETDAGIYYNSGPEISIASTKAFLGQISSFLMLAIYLGRQRKMSELQAQELISEFKNIPNLLDKIFKDKEDIRNIVEKYKKHNNFFYLGRNIDYPIAMEGALKLKETTYIHAEGMPTGEIKHGPLSLIDRNLPIVALASKSFLYDKTINILSELSEKGAKIFAVATKGDRKISKIADDVIYIPQTIETLNPFLESMVLHLFAYYMALALGREVDKPRNLAKSVTVE